MSSDTNRSLTSTMKKAGLKAIIALHNTNLGPAVGGCRLWNYESEEAALFDVLRLSRGMSHKNAAAGLPLGGAKGVIIADRPRRRLRCLRHSVRQ